MARGWSRMAPGVLMNNEMDDFSAARHAQWLWPDRGRRQRRSGGNGASLFSMTPTIVLKDGKVWLVTGSPGGARIITIRRW